MAPLTQSSFLHNKQCNSAPPILTSGTLPTLSLDDIHDILSIIKSTTTRLAPQNAHWCLVSIHQGLDFASTKIDKFQDDLRIVGSGAGLDGNLAHAFFDVSDALLDVVRAVEQAPIAIAYAAKIKHPLKVTWGYLKSFGPLPCERQQKLRKIYCSILKVVIKVQGLNQCLSSALKSTNLICNDLIFERKRMVLAMAFTQSFGAESPKSQGCDVALPLPTLLRGDGEPQTRVYVGNSRLAEIRKRSNALAKANSDAQLVGLSRKAWRSYEPRQAIPHGVVESVVAGSRETEARIVVDVKEVQAPSDPEPSDEPACVFRTVNYNPEPKHDVPRPSITAHRQAQQPYHGERKESKLRVDSALDFLPEPDLSCRSFEINGLKKWEDGFSDLETDEMSSMLPMVGPPEIGNGYFDC